MASTEKVFARVGKCENVRITAAGGIKLPDVLESTPFKDWAKSMDEDLIINNVHIQSVDYFGKRVGFIKFISEVTDAEGHKLPGIVFMRGGAVAVLVVLECEKDEYCLLTQQARVPIGKSRFLEIPAGMLDGSGHFSGVAAKEMEEETGIVIEPSDLVDLTDAAYGSKYPGMYPSCGGSDEFIRIFAHRKQVTREYMQELHGKLTGSAHENEFITLHIAPLANVWELSPDSKTLSALLLWDKLRKRLF